MSERILNVQGILSSDVPTGNLIWVDQVNGVDGLATRGRMTIPFRTLGAARTAASSGDTIIVLPGTYYAQGLAKAGVNWHFLNGVRVEPLMSGSMFLVDSAMTFKVTGYGVFDMLANDYVLEITHSSANVEVECNEMYGATSAVKISGGTCTVVVKKAESDDGACIDVSGGTSFIRAREVLSSSSDGVAIGGTATVDLDVVQITGSGGKGISFAGGTARVRAVEVRALVGPAVEYNNVSSAVLSIVNARLISTYANANGRAVYIASNSNALKLKHCTLVANRSGTVANSIGAASAQNVNLYGECAANNPTNNVTIVTNNPGGSPLTQNTNLT